MSVFGVDGRRGKRDLRFGKALLRCGGSGGARSERVVAPNLGLFKDEFLWIGHTLLSGKLGDIALTQLWNILDSEGIHAQITAVQSSIFDQIPDHA